jgi:hypothetical protein
MVDKPFLSRGGNYSVGVQVPLPLQRLKFNVTGLNFLRRFCYLSRIKFNKGKIYYIFKIIKY